MRSTSLVPSSSHRSPPRPCELPAPAPSSSREEGLPIIPSRLSRPSSSARRPSGRPRRCSDPIWRRMASVWRPSRSPDRCRHPLRPGAYRRALLGGRPFGRSLAGGVSLYGRVATWQLSESQSRPPAPALLPARTASGPRRVYAAVHPGAASTARCPTRRCRWRTGPPTTARRRRSIRVPRRTGEGRSGCRAVAWNGRGPAARSTRKALWSYLGFDGYALVDRTLGRFSTLSSAFNRDRLTRRRRGRPPSRNMCDRPLSPCVTYPSLCRGVVLKRLRRPARRCSSDPRPAPLVLLVLPPPHHTTSDRERGPLVISADAATVPVAVLIRPRASCDGRTSQPHHRKGAAYPGLLGRLRADR